MMTYMKCIKTGCDVNCDGVTFHGDLMYYNGTLVLSGCPNGAYFQGYDFVVENMIEIPGAGQPGRSSFILTGNIEQVDRRLLNQFKEYETEEVIAIFEKEGVAVR